MNKQQDLSGKFLLNTQIFTKRKTLKELCKNLHTNHIIPLMIPKSKFSKYSERMEIKYFLWVEKSLIQYIIIIR